VSERVRVFEPDQTLYFQDPMKKKKRFGHVRLESNLRVESSAKTFKVREEATAITIYIDQLGNHQL